MLLPDQLAFVSGDKLEEKYDNSISDRYIMVSTTSRLVEEG